jgi:hypothetical protein
MAGESIISTREMEFHLVRRFFAWGYFRAMGRALYGEILKLNQDGELRKRTISTDIRQRRRNLKVNRRLQLKRNEEKRAKREQKMITPLSPLRRKTKRAIRVPVPAPKRSEK